MGTLESTLGRRAEQIMTREPSCLTPDMSIRAMARALEAHEVSGFPVVDQTGVLVGIVTKTDLIRRCLEPMSDEAPGFFFQEMAEQLGEDVELEPEAEVRVEDIMTTEVVTASPDETLSRIARRMADARVHRVVVIDTDHQPVGIITSMDVLKAIAG